MDMETSQKLDPQCAHILELAVGIFEQAAATENDQIDIVRKYTSSLMETFSVFSETNKVITEDLVINSGQVNDLPARLYKPENPTASKQPLIVFFHGGGWSVGDIDSYDSFVRALCSRTGVQFLSVGYRRAPEARFPAAHDDCFHATVWAFKHAQQLGAAADKISLMGDSAGATLAINTAWRIAQQAEGHVKSLYLFYPFLDVGDQSGLYPSRKEFGTGEYLIDQDGLELTVQWYFAEKNNRQDPNVSPLFIDNLECLPETVIVTAGCDPLKDEGLLFARKLADAGVVTHTKHVSGAIHGFLSFGTLGIAQQAINWVAKKVDLISV